MIQEPDARVNVDVLRLRRLRRVSAAPGGVHVRKEALQMGVIGRDAAAVEADEDCDLCLVGLALEDGGSAVGGGRFGLRVLCGHYEGWVQDGGMRVGRNYNIERCWQMIWTNNYDIDPWVSFCLNVYG